MTIRTEPAIRVGLIHRAQSISFELHGPYTASDGTTLIAGNYIARSDGSVVRLQGPVETSPLRSISVTPVADGSRFTVHGVTIGIDFHWQQNESQTFQGAFEITPVNGVLRLTNQLSLEAYLAAVVSSEMSASCPPELLRAHAVVSRSWLLAQLERRGVLSEVEPSATSADEIVRWYDREAHQDFDVCADDHCQRYQGIGKAFAQAAVDSVVTTRGLALVYSGAICDTRYSKCCGGMTEVFSTAWDDKDVPYLAAVYDAGGDPNETSLPLSSNPNAERFIASKPDVFCNTASGELLSRILPGFDQATHNFFRWQIEYGPEELGEIVESRLGFGLGAVQNLEPLERGTSGRIRRLRITGENGSVIIGKELEIRRTLSRSHLYSSAFAVRKDFGATGEVERFRLSGAGWGHGVGLCQIGAAVMADLGKSHEEILAHYFRGAHLERVY